MDGPSSTPRTGENSMRLNSKTIMALVALVSALSGAVELRTKVGTISDRLDRVEHQLEQLVGERRYARTD